MALTPGDVPSWLAGALRPKYPEAPESATRLGTAPTRRGSAHVHLVRYPSLGAVLAQTEVYPNGNLGHVELVHRFAPGAPAPEASVEGTRLVLPDATVDLGTPDGEPEAVIAAVREEGERAQKLDAASLPTRTSPLTAPDREDTRYGELLDPAFTIRSLEPTAADQASGEFAQLAVKTFLLDESALNDGVYLTVRGAEALKGATFVLDPVTLMELRGRGGRGRGDDLALRSVLAILQDARAGVIAPVKEADESRERDPVRRTLDVALAEGALLITTNPALLPEALLRGVPLLEAMPVRQQPPRRGGERGERVGERAPTERKARRPRTIPDDKILEAHIKGRTESGNLFSEYQGTRVIFPKTQDLELETGSPVKFRVTRVSGTDYHGDFVIT